MKKIRSTFSGEEIRYKKDITSIVFIVFALILIIIVFAIVKAKSGKVEATVDTSAISVPVENEITTKKTKKKKKANAEEQIQQSQNVIVVLLDDDEPQQVQQVQQEELTQEQLLQQQLLQQALIENQQQNVQQNTQQVVEQNNYQQQTQTTQYEEYTNGSNYDSNSINNGPRYYITVNILANVVTVYEKDSNGIYTIPVRAMLCSTGTYTPEFGQYKITGYKRKWNKLQGDVYGQYATQIIGNILFHSVPYAREDPSTLLYGEYDKLGTSASLGCVRMKVEDVKWIYDNIEAGTVVEFYASSDPGPLGKPALNKISGNVECRDWDPTDYVEGNPWLVITN